MDVAESLAVLRRRWLAVVVCLLAGLAGALSVTRSTEKTYRASARLFVNVSAARGVQEALQGFQLTTGVLKSYAEVATSRAAAQRMIDDLDLATTAEALSQKLSAEPQGETLLITVSATDADPRRAEVLANAAADVFVDLIREFESDRENRIEARLIDAATRPGTPVQPKPKRNLFVGGALGAALGMAVAFLLEALDKTIKSPDQAAAATGRPLLAVVPKRKISGELAVLAESGDASAEAYRSLRTSIRFLNVEQAAGSVMVTSPSAGEGKTTTAANLAVAFAQSGAEVVLVDGDLRRGRLATAFGLSEDVGVTSVLTGQVAVADALQRWGPHLSLLAAGPTPPNPAELIGSRAMARLLTQLDDDPKVDVLIIDAPPIVPVTDAVALSTQVQAVVMVVRAGRTRRDTAAEATRRLEVVGAEVIGCVLNGVGRTGSMRYHSDYRYTPRTRRRG